MKRAQFTKQGYDEHKREYEQLLADRPAAVADLKKAREMGDLSENGYYKSARAKLSSVDHRLRQLKYILATAQVVERQQKGTVEIGSTVTVTDGTIEKTFTIVGGYEANPSAGKLSHLSPIGKALLGKKNQDSVEITTPSQKITYTITKLS